MPEDLFTQRKPLVQILDVPPEVTSVYSMVQHIWEGDDEESRRESRKVDRVRTATVDEFFLDPVRSYLERFLTDIADGEGQGYWMLAHFGVGKSHLMAVEAILAIGGEKAWNIVKKKEDGVKGLGPAVRLDRFRDKIAKKKILPVIFTLEGKGGGQEKRLSDFVLDEARNVYEDRTGKPLAITAAHHLADWYLQEGRNDFEKSLKDFIANKRLMDKLPKYDSYADWLSSLQNPHALEDAAVVLRAFLRHKNIKVDTKTEQGELLENAFRHILDSGYEGILLVIDEMSEYMGRTKHPNEDEDCLLVLSSTLAKGKKLPIWTIVAAQEAYAKQDKLIGPDRMREEHLEHKAERFRNIVINRCRSYRIVDGKSLVNGTHNYFMGYREKIPWVQKIEEEQFQDCFPFPSEAVEVIQKISRKLTGTRSTISFLHSALQNTIKKNPLWNELIPIWRVFDELMTYEESKSNSASGTISIKSIFKTETAALESAQNRLGKIETGILAKKAGKRRAEKILNTLFLYHIGGYGGLSPAQILDAVCDLKGDDGVDIQVSYYETVLEEMKTALSGQIRFRDGKYEFTPKETGDFDDLVNEAIEKLKADQVIFWKYFDKLLEYSEAPASPFCKYRGASLVKHDILWHGQERSGLVGFRDLSVGGHAPTPDTSGAENDFTIVLGRRPATDKVAKEYLKTDPRTPDPRVIVWITAALTDEQKSNLISTLAYLKVKDDHPHTKHEKDAKSNFQLYCEGAYDLLKQIYQQGKALTTRKTLPIDWTGGLEGALDQLAIDGLDNVYKSAVLDMGKRAFGTDEVVKLINGLIKQGKAVPATDKLYSAVENFAKPLGLIKAADPEKLNPSGSAVYKEIRTFAESKGGHALPMSVFYNKFTGWQPEDGDKSWGLTRRMVDAYLLAMAQQGVIRVNVKKGPPIDRIIISSIEFKPETLRNFESVEIPKAWIDWDKISPYLETIASVPEGDCGPKFDQTVAHEAIQKISDAWIPSEKLEGFVNRVSELFRELEQKDPYDALLLFWLGFFETPLSGDADDEFYEDFKGHLLKAFDKSSVDDLEKKDLTRYRAYWKQLAALQSHFDDLAAVVRSAGLYSKAEIPDIKEYKVLKTAIKKLVPLVGKASEFLLDPDRMRAELLPALEEVWREYNGPFAHGVNEINNAVSDLRQAIAEGELANELKVLRSLSEAVPDAKRAVEDIKTTLEEGEHSLFTDLPTGAELKKLLQNQDWIRTSRGFELRLKNLSSTAVEIGGIVERCRGKSASELMRVAGFLDDKVLREKLKAHKDKKVIKEFLSQTGPATITKHLLSMKDAALDEFVKLLKAVLTGLKFVTVRLGEFKPSNVTLWAHAEQETTIEEFERFLMEKMKVGIVKIED